MTRRRPVEKTHGARPRAMALFGTFFFYLLAIPTGQPLVASHCRFAATLCRHDDGCCFGEQIGPLVQHDARS